MSVATRALFTGATPARTPGTWTPDGTPATIDAGAGYKAFPGLARLSRTRLLLTYYHGTNHVTDGVIKGRIGTLSGYSVSWGSAFTIYDHAQDVRVEDSASVIGGKVIVAGRLYDQTINHSPFLMVCDDDAPDCDASSTWTKHEIPFDHALDDDMVNGRVIKVGDTYVVGTTSWTTGNSEAGVLINDSLTDWSSPTFVVIGSSGSLSEICIDRLWGQTILALLRRETGTSTYKSLSTDGGATWSAPSLAHDGHGFPTFRRLTDGTLLWVSRNAPGQDNAWRTSADDGATWGSKTILDTTGTDALYATIQQLDHDHALVAYAVEISPTDADLYSQVFTRA